MKFLLTAAMLCCFLLSVAAQQIKDNSSSRKILVPYRDGTRWGYSDTLGKIIVKPGYDSVSTIVYDGYIYKNGKEGLIHESGKIMFPPLYDAIEAQYPYENFYIVQKAGKKGLFTDAGRQIIPFLFDSMAILQEDLILVSTGKKYGLYDSAGKLLVSPQYDEITDAFFDEKVDHSRAIMGRKGEKYWLINKQTGSSAPYIYQGNDVIEGIMDPGVMDEEPRYFLRADSVKKMLGADRVIDFVYKTPWGSNATPDYFLVIKEGKKGLFDKTQNQLVIPVVYEDILYVTKPFISNYLPAGTALLAAVKKEGRAGIINQKGYILLPFEYDAIGPLANNTNGFELTLDGKKGIFMLHTHYPVIAPRYDSVMYKEAIEVNSNWNFSLYKVWYKGQPGYVGENGVEYFR